jgi:hypothetical protein
VTAPFVRFADYRLAFGDIHRHSAVSDGAEDPELHFAAARRRGLDFYALTDHARLTVDPTARRGPLGPIRGPQGTTEGATFANLGRILEIHSIGPAEWQNLKQLVRRYYEPGAFVPILAYEWSCPRYGDHNVYYRTDDGEQIAPDTLPELYAAFADGRALIIPHHTGYAVGRRGKDWNYHHPRLERLVEIFSHHGSSELPDGGRWPLRNIGMGGSARGSSVEDALMRRYKLGFVGGSDAHAGAEVPWVLTGVYAQELTREALFRALWDRRCYATSGPRIELEFSLEDLPMGSLVATDDPPVFRLAVRAPSPIESIELVRNGAVAARWPVGTPSFKESWTDHDEPERPDSYYYVRLLLSDGGAAWSSPIWVSLLPEHPITTGYLYWQTELPVYFEATRSDGRLRLCVTHWAPEPGELTDVEVGVGAQSVGTLGRLGRGERFERHIRASDGPFWARYRDVHGNGCVVLRHRSI